MKALLKALKGIPQQIIALTDAQLKEISRKNMDDFWGMSQLFNLKPFWTEFILSSKALMLRGNGAKKTD